MLPFMTLPAVASACYVPTYQTGRSVVLDKVRGGMLSRVFTAGDQTRWTAGGTLLRPTLSEGSTLLSVDRSDNGQEYVFSLRGDGKLEFYGLNSSYQFQYVTTQVFRDSTGPIHWHVEWDSANAIASERVRIHIGLSRITAFDTAIHPAQSLAGKINGAGSHSINGCRNPGQGYSDQILCRFYFVGGVNLGVGTFVETNIHGVQVMRAPGLAAAGYGVNGCYLDISDPLQPGKDVSGQGNHWTASGIDSTGKDMVASTPTNVYGAWNPLPPGSGTVSDGGLIASGAGGTFGTLPIRVPVYFEVQWTALGPSTSSDAMGVIDLGAPSHYVQLRNLAVALVTNTSGVDSAVVDTASWSTSAVYACAVDPVARTVKFYKGGSLLTTVALPSGGEWVPYSFRQNSGSALSINFGQRPFAHTPPAGYKTQCTANLPEPGIKDPAEGYAAATATGADLPAVLDAATAHWAGAGYVEIIKRREASEDWRWRFSDDPANAIASNNANAKAAAPDLAAAGAYVGMRLRIGRRYGVWTGEVEHTTGTATTITHGLGTVRTWVMATRVSAGGGDRYVWHPDLPAGRLLKLNATDFFTDATLTVFGADSFRIDATAPSGSYRVLVLAERSGFIHLGQYGGNSSSDGAFASCDVSPDFFLTKEFTVQGSNSGWFLALSALTGGANPVKCLFPNWGTWTESTAYPMDLVVGGVKLRYAAGDPNQSGRSYVTIAIGRPIGGVCVAPATAR